MADAKIVTDHNSSESELPNTGKFNCPPCNRSFKTSFGLLIHTKSHNQVRGVDSCKYCAKVIHGKLQLNRHIIRNHRAEVFRTSVSCKKCGQVCCNQDKLDRHIKAKHENIRVPKTWICHRDQCGQVFHSQKLLSQHFRGQHKRNKPAVKICSECGKTCLNRERLKSHMRIQHPKCRKSKTASQSKTQMCHECGELFPNKTLLHDHLKEEHGIVPEAPVPQHVCQKCGKVCRSRPRLESHIRNQHEKIRTGLYIKQACPQCGKICPTHFRLLSHIRNKHEKIATHNKRPCPECGKICNGQQRLESHIRTQHEKNPNHRAKLRKQKQNLNCSECGKTCHSRQLLESHIRRQHKKAPKCQFCGKVFKYNYRLQMHMVMHTKETPFKCENCSVSYSYQHSLLRHSKKCCPVDLQNKAAHEDDVEKSVLDQPMFECTQCGQEVLFSEITTHMDGHADNPDDEDIVILSETKSKVYECKICSLKLCSASSLQKHTGSHLRVHLQRIQREGANKMKQKQNNETKNIDNLGPFTCKICSKEFSNRRNIVEHTLQHHSRKLYKCDSCDKILKTRNSLYVHKKLVHFGVKNYKCDICNKGFMTKPILEGHMNILHLGVKPFVCDNCDAKYAYKASLVRHIAVCHQKSNEQ